MFNNKTKKKYKVICPLGRGSYGNVYKAVSDDGMLVAVKSLNKHLPDKQKIIEKFKYEAKILSTLNHPNICKLIEIISDKDNCSIVLEFIDGVDLRESVLNMPDYLLPYEQAIKIAGECLDAFQHVFENGVLHRDIKPSNIMICKNSNCKIMDFSIAAFIKDVSQNRVTGELSPAYSAPERFSQKEIADVRSDIYSLGIVFFELFTGRKPFNAFSKSEMESSHTFEIPEPVNSLNPLVSLKISNAIKKALEKRPEDRFNSFLEFKNAMGLDDNNEI